MTYAFDMWMARENPGCQFERYADDIVVHCDTEGQAHRLWAEIAKRLKALGLELHPEKTKVVYCKDANRRGEAEHTSFDFLGYTFRGRLARGPRGYFMSFAPAISPTARRALSRTIRAWHLRRRTGSDLSSIAAEINPQVRGWIGYYEPSIAPSCTSSPGASISISFDGPGTSSNDSGTAQSVRGPGSLPSNGESPDCSSTGPAYPHRRVGL